MTIHVFATILALYPFTKVEDISEEFGMPPGKIRRMARICRVKKSADFRSEINRRNGRKSVERNIRRKIRREQRAVKLRKEGASVGEIAKRLKISKDTVYKYLLNARRNGELKS